MIRTAADVVVIGAGVIGAAIAREVSGSGLSVVVIERDKPGSGASGAAAGILSPQAEADKAGPLLDLCLESRTMFPGLVEELKSETGIEVPYRTAGTLYLAMDDAQEARLEKRYTWQTAYGLPVERISGGRVATLEPSVAARARIALRFPYDHQIDNVALVRALTVSAEKRGAQFRNGVEAGRVLCEGGKVRGVALGPGRIDTPTLIVCGGAWSGQLDTGGPPIPVVPVRGQMAALESEETRLDRVLFTEQGYLVPRLDGRILVGSTTEHAGFDLRVTARGVCGLLEMAQAVVPALEKATIARLWAGLRPGTPDGLPVLGAGDSRWPSGLVYATGHYRNGILLAPLTARLLAEVVLSGKTAIPLDPFLPSRFV